jgi:hypothetical protein
LLGALGLELVVRPNPDAAKKMAPRWERRNEKQVRASQPVSRQMLDRCRSIIMAELGYLGEPNGKLNGHNGYKG